MRQETETRKTIYSIRSPDTSFLLFNSACDAIRITMEKVQGTVEPQVLATIETDLQHALDDTFRRANTREIRNPTPSSHNFESRLSSIVMSTGRDINNAISTVNKKVYETHIQNNANINPNVILAELRKGYAKALGEIDKEIKVKLKALGKSDNKAEKIFEKALLENLRASIDKLKQKIATDQNLFQSADPIGKASADARKMYHEQAIIDARNMREEQSTSRVTKTNQARANPINDVEIFIDTNFRNPVAEAIHICLVQQLSDFQNKGKEPMSHEGYKRELNNFFDPLLENAHKLNNDDPSKAMILSLLMEAKARASLVINAQIKETLPELGRVNADSRRSSIRLESISSESSSKRGSIRLESMGSEPVSRRGSVGMGSKGTTTPVLGDSTKSSKGLIPVAFRIDPKILGDLKAKREAEQQAESQSKSSAGKNSNN